MQKIGIKQPKRNIVRAATIKKTADLLGVSTRYVRMVLDGDRESDQVMEVFMEISERENTLLQEVKNLLPAI